MQCWVSDNKAVMTVKLNASFFTVILSAMIFMGGGAALAQASEQNLIIYPANEWMVSLIEQGKNNPEKAYCLAANQFEDNTVMILAMKPDGKTSLALNLQKPFFNKGGAYGVDLAFPSGVKGEFVGRAENDTTVIIQVGADPLLWKNVLNHSFFEISGDDFGHIYSLDDFDFVHDTLNRCATEINDEIEMLAAGIVPPSQLSPEVKTLQEYDLFDDEDARKAFEKTNKKPEEILRDLFGQPLVQAPQPSTPVALSRAEDDTIVVATGSVDPVKNEAVPSLPKGYSHDAVDYDALIIRSTTGDIKAQDVMAVPVDPVVVSSPVSHFAGNDNLPSLLNALLLNAGETVKEGSVETSQDVDYVRYRWHADDGKEGEFEQVTWPQGVSFYDMAQNYMARKETRCEGKMMPSMDEPYRSGDVALAEGKIFCMGRMEQNFAAIVFYGVGDVFSTFSLKGPMAKMVTIMDSRNAVLKQIEETGNNSHPPARMTQNTQDQTILNQGVSRYVDTSLSLEKY